MKNKKGFTLIELLAIIGVIAIIMIIVTPKISSSTINTKENIFQTKIKIIEKSAILYGQDHINSIIKESNKEKIDDTIYNISFITVKELVENEYYTPDYYKYENNVIDPRYSDKYLDNDVIKIKINSKTKDVTAEFQNK